MENKFETNIGTNLDTTHTLDLSDKLYKVVMIALAGGGIFLAGQWFISAQGLPQNAPHEIQVQGEGKAYAKPDVAIVSFGAHTEAEKSQDAVSQNNKIMDAVISAIKKLGVDQKDIQTTSYNLQPLYDYGYAVPMMESARGAASSSGSAVGSGGTSAVYPVPPKGRVFRGYTLDQQVQVKIRNFDTINAVMDAATSHGANAVGQLQFTIDDMEQIKSQARDKAIDQAKRKAKSMFADAGLLGAKLVDISEGYGNYPVYAMALDKGAGSSSTPPPQANIQPGQQEINITVTLTYRVK